MKTSAKSPDQASFGIRKEGTSSDRRVYKRRIEGKTTAQQAKEVCKERKRRIPDIQVPAFARVSVLYRWI